MYRRKIKNRKKRISLKIFPVAIFKLLWHAAKTFQWGLQYNHISYNRSYNLLMHQNFLLGPKCFQKYQWKYHSFLLLHSPLQAISTPTPPRLVLSSGRLFPAHVEHLWKLLYPPPKYKYISSNLSVYHFLNTEA